MRFIESRPLAAISFFWLATQLVLPQPAGASTKPRYGGTLRVELHTTSVSLDPRTWQSGSLQAAADEKLAALIFERLVALDNYGHFQPVLATEWSHDAASKRWQFTIRSGVKFSDGTALNPADVVAALQPLLPESLQVSVLSNTVVIQSAAPVPDLLEQLASGRYFVYRSSASDVLVGTGPFMAGEAPIAAAHAANAHLSFRANEDTWSGRPFLDGIEVTLGVPPLRAMFDLQLGKADLVELAPDLVPRATQGNLRIWISDPVTFYGLRFDDEPDSPTDPRLREALALCLDRAAMANVLLQKQAQPAPALLPQWLSGYAFLFDVNTNLELAKELRHSLPARAGAAADPLRLRVDPDGELPKLLGERVAVNARQASIAVQVVHSAAPREAALAPAAASTAHTDPVASVHLFAWRYSSLSPRSELDAMLAAYNLNEPQEARITNSSAVDREQLFARERQILESWRVLPLVEQAESVALAPSIRDWMPARWGEWHLEEVWLDQPESPTSADSSSPSLKTRGQTSAPASGAKP